MLSCVHDESTQAALTRFVPQSQQGLALRHIEADVEALEHQQVQQPTGDNAAVPGTGEAKGWAVNLKEEESNNFITL